jgi:protein-S-isoprenylcysteine O-methyltransferase Ste14
MNFHLGTWGAREILTAVIDGAWLAFALYWLMASFNKKRVQRREPPLTRLIHVLWLALGFFLFYSDDPRFGVLNRRFVPLELWIACAGAALAVAGVGFAIWARVHLGRNWSGEVTIRQDHELIRTGPYARLRHPIYTGLLLALAGTVIAVGKYRALVAFAIFLIGWTWKARREEAFLVQEFGARFEEHKKHTGFFLPRVS